MKIRNALSEKIAGEITLSPKPGQTIRKWRNVFKITQTDLAIFLNQSPSVISDYESGRRQSPGIQTVKRIIEAFIEIDHKRGGKTLHKFQSLIETHEGIIERAEYPYAIPVDVFIQTINGNVLTAKNIGMKNNVKGFTLVDSVKTIETINSSDYVHLYGWNPERALIFTGIRFGRSPMIAVRVHPVKPNVVVYHKPGSVDSLAIKLAERENIPLVITNLPLEKLNKKLISLGEK